MAEDPVANEGVTGPGEPGDVNGDRRIKAELGINLLKEVEVAICGPHVSEFPEVAEGLSLTTDRTAVICLREDVPSRKLLPGVYHFQIPTKWSSFYRDAIMLAPVSFQEAVDLCLAAHTLSDWTRRPVVSIHREVFAQSYGKVEFPTAEQLATTEVVERGEKSSLMAEAVIQDLEKLKSLTGGDIDAVRFEGDPEAPIAVIIPGLAPPRVRKLLAARDDVKTIFVTLLNPFPLDQIMELVGSAEEVVLMLPRKNPFHKRLFSNLKYYIGDRFRREVWTGKRDGVKLPLIPPLLKETARKATSAEKATNLGISSAGDGATQILQEFAATCPECRDGEFEIKTVERHNLTVLTSGVSRGVSDFTGELDLLIVDLTEGRKAEPGLRQLKAGGHLVLIGDLDRMEALSGDVSLLDNLRKERKWKIWSCSAETGWPSLVRSLSGLIFDDSSPGNGKDGEAVLERINWELLEGKIRERKQELARIGGSLRFPEEVEGEAESGNWPGIIREFFLTGSCPEDIYSRIDFSSPAKPAILHNLENDEVFETGYPLVATRKDGTSHFLPIREIIGENVDGRHISLLIKAFAAALEERARAVCEFDDELVRRALEVFSRSEGISEGDTEEAGKGLERAFSGLSDSARVLTFSRAILPVICQSIASEQRADRQREFREEVSMLSGQLGDLLEAEERRSKDAKEDEIAGEFGEGSSRFLDPAAMVKLHQKHKASPGFTRERREKLSWAYKVLRNFLKVSQESPEAYFVLDKYTYEASPLPGVSVQTHENPFLFAAGIFDGLAEQLVEVLKAVQLARRETESDGGSGAESLTDKLDWTFLEMDELSLIPPVVVLISSEKVFEQRLSSLGRLISSGRPVAVLVTSREFDVTGDEMWPKHSGISPDLWHLILAFRELFVMQGSLALPMNTVKGLRDWIAQPVPSVALVAVPKTGSGGFEEWWRSYAACLGRAVPCFRYDPSAGVSWEERLDLEGNVLAEETWIRKEFDVKMTDGSVKKMEDTITPAHAAVLKARYSAHFLTIPEEAWDENQIEFREYLDKGIKLEPHMIPYIWVLSPENTLRRAILTRDVVYACQERGGSWRMFQQLSGAGGSASAEREEAEPDLKVQVGQEELKTAREEGASQVIDRLVEMLAGSPLAAQPPVPSVTSPLSSTKPPEDVKIKETEKKELPLEDSEPPEELEVLEEEAGETEEELSEEPYIESDLCTSCNDCINLNPKMFQYNKEKQACIADPEAGTYKQLVVAAENCPSKCIYPGQPRPGDETATDEMIARAKAIH